MKHIQIINKERGRNKQSGKILADAISAEIETIARQQAAKNGINVDSERGGLMRAITQVMGRPELLQEATRRARDRLERAGVIPAEDERVVKHKDKY